jgi:hypothetical protein
MQDNLRAVRKAANALRNCSDPASLQAYSDPLEFINPIEEAMSRWGI